MSEKKKYTQCKNCQAPIELDKCYKEWYHHDSGKYSCEFKDKDKRHLVATSPKN